MRSFSRKLACGASVTVSYFTRGTYPEEAAGDDDPSSGVFKLDIFDLDNSYNNATLYVRTGALRQIGLLLARLQKIAAKEM